MMKCPPVYILANKRRGTLYVGVPSDLVKRMWEHRNAVTGGFTGRYAVHDLEYYEVHAEMRAAITREKQIKRWNRAWKIQLIEERNSGWDDLWQEIVR